MCADGKRAPYILMAGRVNRDHGPLGLELLQNTKVRIDPGVAFSILAEIPEADLPTALPRHLRYRGETMANVMRSSQARATLLLAGCSDPKIQLEHIDLYFASRELMETVLLEQDLLDVETLREIHQKLWSSPYNTQAVHETARRLSAETLPLDLVVEWVGRNPGSKYAYETLGERMASDWGDGIWRETLSRIEKTLPSGGGISPEGMLLCRGFARGLAREGAERAVEVCSQLGGVVRETWIDEIVASVYSSVETVTVELLKELLARIVDPGHFREHQLRQIAEGRNLTSSIPSELQRMAGTYTKEAFRLLAQTYPGAIQPVIIGRAMMPSGMEPAEIVRIALGTNHPILARALLGNIGNGGRYLDANLDLESFLRALDICEQGPESSGCLAQEMDPYLGDKIDPMAAASNLPAEAEVGDMLRLMRHTTNWDDYILQLYGDNIESPGTAHLAVLRCKKESFRALYEQLDDSQKSKVFLRLLRMWNCEGEDYDGGPMPNRHPGGSPGRGTIRDWTAEAVEAYLEIIIETIPAREFGGHLQGRAYLAHILGRELGEDGAAWTRVLALIPGAEVPIGRVIRAAKTLP